ncbi:MAG: hypothetical protein JXN61_16030 [Sedimentisphaerales bacterium]|nr:hypothetical protein [Sedimentisphaerales bacterium]
MKSKKKSVLLDLAIVVTLGSIVGLCSWSSASGAEWQQMSSPTDHALFDVWGSAADNVFAISYADGTGNGPGGLVLHYDGASWNVNSALDKFLTGIWGSSATDIWAVGHYGVLLHSSDGITWEQRPEISSGNHFWDVWGTAPDNVWAVGESIAYTGPGQNRGIIWHWDGLQWSFAGAYAGDGETQFNGVGGRGANEVYTVGSSGYGFVFDGTSWNRLDNWYEQALEVWGTDTDLFVASMRRWGHFDGSQWEWGPDYGFGNNLTGISGTSAQNVYMVGVGGRIIHFDGSEWSEMDSGTTNLLHGVWVSETGTVFAVGLNGTILRLVELVEPPVCWEERAKLLASDGDPDDRLGVSVGISGDTIIVGAYHDDHSGLSDCGAAYLFDLTTGLQLSKLMASDASSGDYFGYGAVISESVAIVGAYGDDSRAGSAYMFDVSDPYNPVQIHKLIASDPAAIDDFGSSGMAISGSIGLIGANADDDGGLDSSGSVYVFDLTSGVEITKMTASDASAYASFGFSCAMSGTTAIIGAVGNTASDTGAAYLFDMGDPYHPAEVAKIANPDAQGGSQFGHSVSVFGNAAVVGANYHDEGGLVDSGAAYLFDITDIYNPVLVCKLTPAEPEADSGFGYGLAMNADTVAVSAVVGDSPGLVNCGVVYLFDATTGEQIGRLTASDGADYDQFGYSVAISENTIIVGANQDDAPASDSGSAYVFENTCNEQRVVVDAGENIQILSEEQALTVICGTASDPDGDSLEHRWVEGEVVLLDWTAVPETGLCCLDLATLAELSVGDHLLTLEVREGGEGGLTASDDMVLTVNNSPPEAQPGPAKQTVQVGVDPIVVIADVADFDGDILDYVWLKNGEILGSGIIATTPGGDPVAIPDLVIPPGDARFPVQEEPHVIVLEVSDGVNAPVSPSVLVTVIDTQAPTLSPLPSATILWPPNHELQPVTIAANAFDNGGGAITLAVTVVSSEPPDTDGDGNTIPDYYIDSIDDATGIIELRLRSERSGTGDGRTYTITITATDESGNFSEAVVSIRAPHDKRKK